ncbi:MFS transporter [Roseospirillum parvum]|uniref:Sugar phosphate permease n=1 Tax=Roseospirillum parvum TaxID=83401 RepID=A0A1G8CNJ1_9PROT|nr:MFS transporter [Roseospirillum parvum]SDH46873.1 Sugar phosphate permease [Roseospirillum parvum]
MPVTKALKWTGLAGPEQAPVAVVGLGHAGVHWIAAVFYLVLPFITEDLGLSYAQAGALVAVFHATSVVINIASGFLVDVTGRRVLWQTVALIAGALGLAGFALTRDYTVLALLVALIAASNNLWHPAAISWLSRRYPANRGYVLSVHALGANLGDALAPLAAGALLAVMAWGPAAALAALPVGAVAWVLWRTLASRRTGAAGDHQQVSLAGYFGGMVKVVRDRAVLGLALMAGFRTMAQSGLLAFLPLYLANDLGLSPLAMGAALAAMQAGGVIAGPAAGVLSDRIGRRRIVIAGLGLSTVVILALALAGRPVLFVAGVTVLGFVMYAIRPVIHSWMMDITPANLGGSATSLLFGVQAGLSALAPLIGGLLADAFGLVTVFWFLAAAMLVSNLIALRLPPDHTPTSAQEAS